MKAVPVLAGMLALGLLWAGWEIRALRTEAEGLRAEVGRGRVNLAKVAGSVDAAPAPAATPPTRSPRPGGSSREPVADSRRRLAGSEATRRGPEVLPDGSIRLTDGTMLTAAAAESLAAASRKATAEAMNKGPDGASYSAGKATGPPEANASGGDSAGAWCPAPRSGQGEWLQLRYARSVEISELNIHETYATGALAKVSAMLPDGTEKVLWEGTEPQESPPVERVVKVPPGIRADQIRLTLDTDRIGNWQEIDAVELIGKDGSRQWASEATASSYWGSGSTTTVEWGDYTHDALGTQRR